MLTLHDCLAMDRSDALGWVRDRFLLPPGVVYLDGNSLGPQPSGVRQQVTAVLDQWSADLIESWWDHDWVGMPARVGAKLERLLGAEPGTVTCTDSTSVNLYKVTMAAAALAPGSFLTDSGNFPTDLYILSRVAAHLGRHLVTVDPLGLVDAIGPDVGVVVATHVDFRSGRRHDLAAVTHRAHQFGGLVVWDLSHSAGAMPVDLAANKVDLAVGCGYKYLNGGPGAPAYVYVAPRWQAQIANPITGWFGHLDTFAFDPNFVPSAGIERMRVGTPDILSMAALEAALDVWEGVDLTAVREKSEGLTALFIDLVDQQLGKGVEVVTPRQPVDRGSQVTLRLAGADALMRLLAQHGVIGDYRPPDLIRFGLAPLFVRFVDVWDAVDAIGALS